MDVRAGNLESVREAKIDEGRTTRLLVVLDQRAISRQCVHGSRQCVEGTCIMNVCGTHGQ